MKRSSDPFFLVVASGVRARLLLGHFNIHLASYTPLRRRHQPTAQLLPTCSAHVAPSSVGKLLSFFQLTLFCVKFQIETSSAVQKLLYFFHADFISREISRNPGFLQQAYFEMNFEKSWSRATSRRRADALFPRQARCRPRAGTGASHPLNAKRVILG